MTPISRRAQLLAQAMLAAALPIAAAVAAPVAANAQEVPTAERTLPVLAVKYPYGADAAVEQRPVDRAAADLRDAITLAYWTNPQLLAQRATLRSADNRVPGARAAYGPQLDFVGSHGYQRDRTEIVQGQFIGRDGLSSTASLIFNQPLFTFGRNRSAESSALAQVAFGRDQLRLIEADVMLSVVSSYVAVVRDTQSVGIAQANLALLTEQFADSEQRYGVREITATDLEQVRTRVSFGRAQLLEAQGNLDSSRANFLRVVGAVPGELGKPDAIAVPVGTLDQAHSIAQANSPVILAAQSREKITRAAVAAARAEQGPRVDLQGTGAYGAVSPYQNDLRTTNVRGEVVLSVPLIDSGLRRAQVREAEEAMQADWRLIDQAVRDTREAVTSAWAQLTAARASLTHYQTAVDAAQRAYDGALIQERAGARTTLDVLDLARDLLTVRTNYVIAEANEYVSRAQLLAAMGRLEAPLLVPGVTAYDPTVHYERVARRGNAPLLTPALSALDSIPVGDLTSDRPVRDPAAVLTTGSSVPLVDESTVPKP